MPNDATMIGVIDSVNIWNHGDGMEGTVHVRADHGFGGRTIRLYPDDYGKLLADIDRVCVSLHNYTITGRTVRCHPGSVKPFTNEWIEVLG